LLDTNQPITLKKQDKIAMAIIGLLVVGIIAVPVLTYLATITALLATVLENTIYSLIMAGGILLSGLWLKDNWTALLYKWKNMARNVRRAVVNEDPIGVMDTAISRLEAKLVEVENHIKTAGAAKRRQEDAITKLEREAAEQDRLLAEAQTRQRPENEIGRIALAGERRRKSAENLKPQLDLFEEVYANMIAAKELCNDRLMDMRDNREVFKLEYETMQSGQNAAKGMRKFFGANDDLNMLHMSIDVLEQKNAEALEEIDSFMRVVTPQLNNANLQKQADVRAALSRANAKLLPSASGENKLIEAMPVKEGVVVDMKRKGA
jgi:hypothetical protein